MIIHDATRNINYYFSLVLVTGSSFTSSTFIEGAVGTKVSGSIIRFYEACMDMGV